MSRFRSVKMRLFPSVCTNNVQLSRADRQDAAVSRRIPQRQVVDIMADGAMHEYSINRQHRTSPVCPPARSRTVASAWQRRGVFALLAERSMITRGWGWRGDPKLGRSPSHSGQGRLLSVISRFFRFPRSSTLQGGSPCVTGCSSVFSEV